MVSAERQAGCDVDKRGIEARRWTGPEREIHRTAGTADNTNVQPKKKHRNTASHNAATKRRQSTSMQRGQPEQAGHRKHGRQQEEVIEVASRPCRESNRYAQDATQEKRQ